MTVLAAVIAALVIGHSVQGRPLRALEVGDPSSPHRVLVVGCIHGNECAGLPLIWKLAASHPDFDLWLVPNVNPDGYAANTRHNAHGVDLNRNFPTAAGALSEPESRAAYALILKLRPELTIWLHQPQDVVRAWGHSVAAGQRFARLAGMRFRAIAWPPGSASNWQNHRFRDASSFVVELPAGPLSQSLLQRLTSAVLAE